MRPDTIEEQAHWSLFAGAARKERPQEGIFDIEPIGVVAARDLLTAPCGWALAPDGDEIIFAWTGKTQVVASQREHPAQSALQEKTAIECKKPPARFGVGGVFWLPLWAHHWPLMVEAAPTVLVSVPVTAEMVLFQVVIGASVT